ncbi:energy transducer TonB [Ramlibacter sp. MMS24-I3-19]|uniref:energy transducer TonB n=1 Tax=Ramlibacter sp. MMS24-I3-19 TaxID=3416606 RepID=UPI003CFC404E
MNIPFPAIEGMVDLRIQLALFIDASGNVRRVRVDTADVPPAFAQVVQDAFLSARFQPGEVDAVPVPSQIRVEVEFGAKQGR